MAELKVTMPDDLMRRLTELGPKTDEICAKCLEAGADVLVAQVKRNLAARIGEGTKYDSRSTGKLLGSLGKSSVKVDRDGRSNLKVGFSEPRRGAAGNANAKIAAVLEYGKTGQPAKPFMKPAQRQTKKEVEAVMARTFEQEVAKL